VIILNVRRLILVAVVLALVLPSLFMFTRGEVRDNASYSGSFMEDVRVINRGSGKDRWILSAKKVDIAADSRSTKLHAVSIAIPEYEMEVTSDEGLFDIDSRNLTLLGNIEARTDDYALKTNSILLESQTNELSSDDRVILEGSNFRVEGDGFHANGEKKVTIENNVKATFF
jgi:LPS export ABC transporter protein LptC